MSDNTEHLTRAEHLDWAKQRALDHLDKGQWGAAWISFRSDMDKHPETREHIHLAFGDQTVGGFLLNYNSELNDYYVGEVRRLIEGFN